MKRRQTIVVFLVPATFTPIATQTINGRRFDIGEQGKTATNGHEAQSISRRGHVDPAKMRDLAVARGAVDSEFEVSWHETDQNLRHHRVADFIVNAFGPAKPIRIAK